MLAASSARGLCSVFSQALRPAISSLSNQLTRQGHALRESTSSSQSFAQTPCHEAPSAAAVGAAAGDHPSMRHQPTPSWWLPHSNTQTQELTPELCAVPKKRLTLHRRAHRRVWYWLKRQPEIAKCSVCGEVSTRDQLFSGITGNSKCTGQCIRTFPGREAAPDEYKAPC